MKAVKQGENDGCGSFFYAACLLEHVKNMLFSYLRAHLKLRVAELRKKVHRTRKRQQGFPILIDGTGASEQKRERLLRMGIKVAHLPSDILATCAVSRMMRSLT